MVAVTPQEYGTSEIDNEAEPAHANQVVVDEHDAPRWREQQIVRRKQRTPGNQSPGRSQRPAWMPSASVARNVRVETVQIRQRASVPEAREGTAHDRVKLSRELLLCLSRSRRHLGNAKGSRTVEVRLHCQDILPPGQSDHRYDILTYSQTARWN